MLSLILTIKYLLRTRIVVLSILAVALSSALLICISSLFVGFIGALENAASDHLGDILIQPYPTTKITYSRKLISELNTIEGIEASTPIVSTQGLLLLGKGDVRKVTVWGIDPSTQASVTDIKASLILQGDSESAPDFYPDEQTKTDAVYGYVGIGVLATPDSKTDEYDMDFVNSFVGSKAVLMTGSMDAGEGVKQDIRSLRRVNIPFTICDVAYSGVDQFDTESIYLPIEELSAKLYPSLSSKGVIADTIQIKVDQNVDMDSILERVEECFSEFAVSQMGWSSSLVSFTDIRPTSDITASMIAEYRKQMDILMVIFGIVSGGVILLICCIFYMLVLTRQKDIAIIRSCGAGNFSVASIFLQFGLVVGVLGGALGLWAGRIFTVNINAIERWISTALGLNIWKSSVYMFSRIPNQVDWNMAFKIVFVAIMAALIGSIIPAVIAAAIKPVKILRYE
ncbi:MAG: ABC transporter permease [Sedimentisphaeraceae bacterium JB056]